MSAIVPPNPEAKPEFVEAYDFEYPDLPTFVDLHGLTPYFPHLQSFDTEAIMPSIRHARWPSQEFFLTCLLSSPDGRWFARGGPAHSREEWQSLVRRGEGSLTTLARVRPEQAAAVLMRAGFELPPDLAAKVQASASGGNALTLQLRGDKTLASPSAHPRGEEQTTGPAASGQAPPPGDDVEPVVLRGPDDPVFVWGKEKDPLPPAQYRVIKALVEARAKGKRLSKDPLFNATKDEKGIAVEDPVGALKRLRKRDDDWKSVIDMAVNPGRGYGLKDKPPTPT